MCHSKIDHSDVVQKNAWSITRANFPKILDVFHPGMFRINGQFGQYPAISITGEKCQLQCNHCNGKLLKTMTDGSDPDQFMEQCRFWYQKGKPGILVSGGSDPTGRMPWKKYIHGIKELKKNTTLNVSVHTGLADPDILLALYHAGVDSMLFDLVATKEIYARVFNLKNGISRLKKMIETFEKHQIPVAPHIVLGLDNGIIIHEYETLNWIKKLNISVIVIIQFTPLSQTQMSRSPTADNKDIIQFTARVRELFPSTEISLGCARIRPNPELEKALIMTGINRIALPEPETLKFAMDAGFQVNKHPVCCVVDSQQI